jgi:hypothetical protein
MIGKIALVGIGYVLGTRAGRERYDQIRVAADIAAKRLEKYGARGTLASHGGASTDRTTAGGRSR